MTQRWASFDTYGTLIDWDGGVRRCLEGLWPAADPERLLARYHTVEPLVQEGRAIPYREVLARSLEAVAAIEALPLERADREALATSLPDWPPFGEVPGALAELRRRGWRLALLSNTDPDLLDASRAQMGVEIDCVVTAADAGSYKPAPGHWTRFRELTGADPRTHVHVAASAFHDIEPASRLGIAAVWINRLGETSDLPRAGELPDLRGLPDVLDELVAPATAGR